MKPQSIVGFHKKKVEEGFNSVLEAMISALEKGEKITIYNFGTFFLQTFEERNLFNPYTQKMERVPPKKKVKFRPTSKRLK